jgi:hypothetical protein
MTTPEQLAFLKFPIGPFSAREQMDKAEVDSLIRTVEAAPALYRALTSSLVENDLQKTYREGSWNIQQLVNHVADMQMLHFFRMKKALTESDYSATLVNMDGWAGTADGRFSSVSDSLDMFESITKRYVYLMRSLDEQQLGISYYHAVRKATFNQKQAVAMSAWHVQHHLEHIRIALES